MRLVFAAVLLAAGLFMVPVDWGRAEVPELVLSPAQSRAELQELYRRMEASHFSLFARRSRLEYDEKFRETLQHLNTPKTLIQLRVAFQKFLAFGRIAHANIDFPSDLFAQFRDQGGKAFPLYVGVRAGRVYVTENLSTERRVVPGDEIVSLNQISATEWLRRLGEHVSADNQMLASTLIERRFSPLLWLELGAVEQFRIGVRSRQGGVMTIDIAARSRAEMRAVASPRSGVDWDEREARLLPGGVAYLRPGPFFNTDPQATNVWDTAAFVNFINRSFEGFLAQNARALVIDLRNNPGGDNSFSDPMVAWYATRPFKFASQFNIRVSEAATASNAKRLPGSDVNSITQQFSRLYAGRRPGEIVAFDLPEVQPRAGRRFAGPVYLLINRYSYSNAVQVAALSQDYGFASVLGEETSDLATTYGAMEQFQLSRTGITVNFPKAHIIRVNGDQTPRGVVPDVAIETPLLEGAEDLVLARALSIAQQRR